jgi:hypothetical protein
MVAQGLATDEFNQIMTSMQAEITDLKRRVAALHPEADPTLSYVTRF